MLKELCYVEFNFLENLKVKWQQKYQTTKAMTYMYILKQFC